MGIGFLGLGFQPKWRLQDIPQVPKVNNNIYVIFTDFISIFNPY
jgi:gamma-glutamylcysteine synthetase